MLRHLSRRRRPDLIELERKTPFGRTGFTILEILVAITVFTLVLSIVYGVYSRLAGSAANAEYGTEAVRSARLILSMMTRDLRSAYLGRGKNGAGLYAFISEDAESESIPQDSIHFTTALDEAASDLSGAGSIFCEVSYFMAEDSETGKQVLYYRRSPLLDGDVLSGGRQFILSRKVAGMKISFVDENGEETGTWDSTEGEKKGLLPKLADIVLYIRSGENGQIDLFGTRAMVERAGWQ